MYRRNRRSRLRYRKKRFLNRKKNQVLAPSVKQKIDSHIKVIDLVQSILPITRTIVETGFKPSIRQRRYSIQPHDIVRWQGKLLQAVGIQNKGAYLKMTDGAKTVIESVKQVQVIFHQKSLITV